jgi:histidinol-phosphate aminotransferase
VNLPAQQAARGALIDTPHFVDSIETNLKGKLFWQEALSGMELEVLPSEANFLCVKLGPRAKEIVSDLEKCGLIIRHLGSFGMPEWVRITIGAREENEFAVKMLRAVMEKDGSP